jgi:hypothetical protein
MSKWFRFLGIVAVLALSSPGAAVADGYGTCTSPYGGGRRCTATTTQYECCWGGAPLLCPDGQYVYGGAYWTPYGFGGPQLCGYYEPQQPATSEEPGT